MTGFKGVKTAIEGVSSDSSASCTGKYLTLLSYDVGCFFFLEIYFMLYLLLQRSWGAFLQLMKLSVKSPPFSNILGSTEDLPVESWLRLWDYLRPEVEARDSQEMRESKTLDSVSGQKIGGSSKC